MILTAWSVSDLSNTLTWWERGEYFFSFVVALACFGEYIADFKPRWYRTGDAELDEKRKESISKISTLILVAALVFELVCVVRSNALAGEVIGSINELARSAVDNAGKAQALAQSASDTANSAKRTAGEAKSKADATGIEAGQAEAKILTVSKETAAVQKASIEAEIGFRKYIEQMQLPRRICVPRLGCIEENDPAVRKKWRDEVAKFAGTHAIIQPLAHSDESMDVARGIESLLQDEGWSPEIVDAEHSKIPNGYIFPGVTLVTLEPSPFRYGRPPEVKLVPVQPSALFRAISPLMGLLALDLGPNPRMPNIWGVQFGSELDDERSREFTRYGFRFPPNTMLILVGEKPVPNWIGSNVPLINSATKKALPKK